MHEVTCYRCGRVANVTPDAPHCPYCDTNLRTLIPPEAARAWFYERATDFAARGQTTLALAEAKRGINFVEGSDLRLLAALIARRAGDLDEMRKQVAAIPLEDRLRDEAEWLLRSQQRTGMTSTVANGATHKQGAYSGYTNGDTVATPPDRQTFPYGNSQYQQAQYENFDYGNEPDLDEADYDSPRTQAAPQLIPTFEAPNSLQATVRNRLSPVLAMLFCAAVGVLMWNLWRQDFASINPVPTPFPAVTDLPAADNGSNPGVVFPTATPQGDNPGPAAGSDDAPANAPTAVSIPGDVVQQSGDSTAVAAVGPALGVDAAKQFDLQPYLIEAGRADLAELAIEARLRQNTLLLAGAIPSANLRNELIELVQKFGGVSEVDAINLLVRVPDTYTVRDGDTLWSIVAKFYGNDAKRVDEIAALNTDVLPRPELLSPGMVLKLPPVQ